MIICTSLFSTYPGWLRFHSVPSVQRAVQIQSDIGMKLDPNSDNVAPPSAMSTDTGEPNTRLGTLSSMRSEI